MNKKTRIIIADDHKMFAEGVKAMLENTDDMEIISIVHDGNQLIFMLEKHLCDVVLLDINMPGMDGIDTANIIYKRFPEVRILIITMYDRPEFVRKLMAKVAKGYILKNADPDELIEAIRTVQEGAKYFSRSLNESILNDGTGFDDGFNNKLSAREKEILKLIAGGKSGTEIAEVLFISPYTVDTHRKNILQKLDMHSTAELVKYALQIGLDH